LIFSNIAFKLLARKSCIEIPFRFSCSSGSRIV